MLALRWAVIDADPAALARYHSAALLRHRVHGRQVRFGCGETLLAHPAAAGIRRGGRSARARSQAYGRLNGDVWSACLLCADARGPDVAWVEQPSVQSDTSPLLLANAPRARGRCSAARGPRRRQQGVLVVPSLAPLLRVEGEVWPRDAGFAPAGTGEAGGAVRGLGDGVVEEGDFFVELLP